MQSRLQLAFEARAREKGKTAWSWFGFTPAIVLTSVLFGLGHLLVPIGGQFLATRMSVFFPSLIFGWLRHHTGSITAAVVYHAFANLMVLMMVVHVS
jgi:membrane protease YdiL (CAAX protease family)